MRQLPPEPEIENLVTAGEPEPGGRPVESNVWIIANEHEAVVIDPADDAELIADHLGDRQVVAILCTHAQPDRVAATLSLAAITGAPIHLHPADLLRWSADDRPDEELRDGQRLVVGGLYLHVRHTPGATPGSVSIYVPALDAVFAGDALGGGGDLARLLDLPDETVVHPGHGATVTVGEVRRAG
ncbi:MBL fold metallo-hydrolase [Kitasatospora sp. NPDC058965]|uniref:MBL fold metallo-hydrolase n=1 Tax=Kitasatospora sp. NPDC058965 TaxID=3346682 RepID=UPI0036800602